MCVYVVSDHPNRIEDGTYVILDSDKLIVLNQVLMYHTIVYYIRGGGNMQMNQCINTHLVLGYISINLRNIVWVTGGKEIFREINVDIEKYLMFW